METIRFKVTRWDLLHKYNNPCGCPIYYALRRVLPGANIAVGSSTVAINNRAFLLDSNSDNLARERARSFKGILKGGFKGEITTN